MMDPFECFDDDDDDDVNDCDKDSEDNDSNTATTTTFVVRDDLCGVLAFHAGTEAALLQYVQSKMIPPSPPPPAVKAVKLSTTCSSHLPQHQQQLQQQLMMSTIRQAETLLHHVDDFCLSRHWMMHIGTEKGTSLRPFLLECFDSYQQKQQQQQKNINGNKASRPFQMLELGTYCGYSAIFLVKTLLEECLQRQQQQQSQQAESDTDTGMTTTTVFRLTTVDVVEQHVKIAREMIRLAGVESYIDLVLLTQEDDDDDDHNDSNNNHLSLLSHPSVKGHYEFVFLDRQVFVSE
ncbi:hypothetical protein IV203_022931 [Nitzschia inconspicua]|uniref:Catechol O-methyltransferase n=1 Tax=Nitzschia inconspicua TaxID=303405 RepID=A0A9K3KD17_9STRA|nr:hypothetical protein IV203_022931 [Nitzschia inconspicua]